MSQEELEAFIAKAKDDQSIQDKLKAAKSPEDVVGIAKEYGYKLTADKMTEGELSEEELEGVAGGTWGGTIINSLWYCFKPGDLENRRRGQEPEQGRKPGKEPWEVGWKTAEERRGT